MTAKSAKTSPASGIEISILVPVMNESGNIAPLVDEICAALAGRSFEIIYVDDASNDDSPAELAATAARVPHRVYFATGRAGPGAAIRSALLASRGGLIGVLDGDGQEMCRLTFPRSRRRLSRNVPPMARRSAWQPASGPNARTIRPGFWHRARRAGSGARFLPIRTLTVAAASRCCTGPCSCSCPSSTTCTGSYRALSGGMAGW